MMCPNRVSAGSTQAKSLPCRRTNFAVFPPSQACSVFYKAVLLWSFFQRCSGQFTCCGWLIVLFVYKATAQGLKVLHFRPIFLKESSKLNSATKHYAPTNLAQAFITIAFKRMKKLCATVVD